MNRKDKRKKTLFLLTVAILVTAIFSTLLNLKENPVSRVFSDSVTVIEYYLIKTPINFISGVFKEYTSLKDVYEENKILKQKLNTYASVETNIDAISKEVEDLKKLLGIKHLPSEYKVKAASVIKRDVASWSNSITIDVGTNGGIKPGMAVVDESGLVGVISSATQVTANVELLTAANLQNSIPVYIANGDQTLYGILEGYDSKTETLRITVLTNFEKINDNAKVYTSGLGGKEKAPSNICVGNTKSISKKKDGTTTIVSVKPASGFDKLKYVSVVQQLNE